MKYLKLLITSLMLISTIVGCKEELAFDQTEIFEPIVTEISPIEGRRGTDVTIIGENLKEVDSVTIGGVPALIKYRINSTNMVVTVTADCRTGALTVFNVVGESTAPLDFTVLYPTPQIDAYPTEGFAYDKIIIEGQDLDLVTQVHFDTIAAEISFQQENLIELLVPFVKDLSAEITLTYPTAEGEDTHTLENEFTLEIETPIVNTYPTEAFDSTEITITGEALYSIESVMFDDMEGTILEQGDTSLTVLVPQFPVTSTVSLSLFYYGNEILVTDQFQIQVPTLAYWSNITLTSAQSGGSASTSGTFFDAIFGSLYGPCDWDTYESKIHFFLSTVDGNLEIIGQDLVGSHISQFECSGTALAAEPTKKLVKVRKLSTGYAPDNELINNVKNQTLEVLNNDYLLENYLGNATYTSIEMGSGSSKFAEGDVILFQEYDTEDISFVNYTGAFEIVSITYDDATGEASMTFNCYMGAY